MTDFRISTSWFTSRKRKRLIRALGHAGESALLQLWGYAAASRPDGSLLGLSNADIADEVDWHGDPDEFVGALVDTRLLDGDPLSYQIHDWEDHNPYAAGRPRRSASSRKANNIRWHKEGRHASPEPGCPLCSESDPGRTNPESGSDKVGVPPSLPSLLPSRDKNMSGKPDSVSADVQLVYKAWREHHPRAPGTLRSKSKEYRKIRERLEEGWTGAMLVKAVQGYHRSPWHQGENDRKTKYLGLELMMRDTDHVAKGIELVDEHEKQQQKRDNPTHLGPYRAWRGQENDDEEESA